MDNAKFEFDAMHHLMNRVRGGHQDMSDLRSTQFAHDVAAGEGAYAGSVRNAFLDTRDGLNTNHVSHLAPAQTTWDDNIQSASNQMAGAQDDSVSRFFQNFNHGS